MKLYRIKLRPRSAWITPWQADTIAGLICWTAARSHGPEWLQREIIEPAIRSAPAFVLSDAFPGDLMPVPTALRAHDWPSDMRKQVKKSRWLSRQAFVRFQEGHPMIVEDLVLDSPFLVTKRLRATPSRLPGTSDTGLFSTEETRLSKAAHTDYLSIYVRVDDPFAGSLVSLFESLSHVGFGGDATVGMGQFDLLAGLEEADWLDAPKATANGLLVLSTFQPSASDPTDGLWEMMTKYGKLGPDFGLSDVFKRPLALLRPGACFRAQHRDFVGRAIPMDDVLPPQTADTLREQSVGLIHYALGLAVPTTLEDNAL